MEDFVINDELLIDLVRKSTMTPEEIKKKTKEYENFVEEKLKADLKDIEIILNDKVSKHNDWKDVKQVVKTAREFKQKDSDMSIRVDIGDNILASGEITDLDTVYIRIGLGYMLEMACDEADKYSEIRMKVLQKEINHFRKLAIDVKVHIKLVLLAISELQTTLPVSKQK